MFKNLKHIAFWPAFILIGGAIVLNFANNELFNTIFNAANNFFMAHMGWFANILTIVCLAVCIWAMFSKFGDVRIGGKDAKPTLSNFSWFSISLTSTLAAGLLLRGPSEPIFHIQDPASAITGYAPMSGDAYLFASETMFMHWSFLPYGIMAIAGVAFAFMYFNAKGKYSVSTMLAPVLGKHNNEKAGSIVDGFILFAITIAIASSLGALWVMIFGNTSLERQVSGVVDLVKVSIEDGVGAIPYEALGTFPLGMLICILYLIIMLISFVTYVNANISVMAGLDTKNISLEDPTGAPNYQKVLWGVISAALAYIVGSTIGIDGLKALCNVAGIAAIFIQLGIVIAVVMLVMKWRKYDKTGTYSSPKTVSAESEIVQLPREDM